MKKRISILLSGFFALFSSTASAQYYEIANQLSSLIQPALSGSMRYKGFVEAEYLKGLGNYDADYVGISTSQGFQYASWFYMGVGLGVQYMGTHPKDDWGDNWQRPVESWHSSTTNAWLVPIFTDFRFNIGGTGSVAAFADIKLGASFLMGNDYLRMNQGYVTGRQYFYLRPSIGVRIPVNSKNPKQAFDLGVSYQLLTSNYWASWSGTVAMNAIGVNVGIEW